jgi:hypothetical protein
MRSATWDDADADDDAASRIATLLLRARGCAGAAVGREATPPLLAEEEVFIKLLFFEEEEVVAEVGGRRAADAVTAIAGAGSIAAMKIIAL